MGRALDENWPIRVSSMSTLRRKANIGRPYMSQLILMIGHIDDLDNPEALTEVWRRAMPVVELSRMRPEHYLNGLENDVIADFRRSNQHLFQGDLELIKPTPRQVLSKSSFVQIYFSINKECAGHTAAQAPK